MCELSLWRKKQKYNKDKYGGLMPWIEFVSKIFGPNEK